MKHDYEAEVIELREKIQKLETSAKEWMIEKQN